MHYVRNTPETKHRKFLKSPYIKCRNWSVKDRQPKKIVKNRLFIEKEMQTVN